MTQELDEPTRFQDGSAAIIGACIEVHRHLGPGLLESTYAACLARELTLRDLPFRRQVDIPVDYKGVRIDCGYRVDFIVDERVILELKAVERISPIHEAQTLTYLKLTAFPVALIVNFNAVTLKQGLRRLTIKSQAAP